MKAGVGRYQINPPPREKLFWVTTPFTSHADRWDSHIRMLYNGSFSLPYTLCIPWSNATARNHT